jgi:hypothetical protein
VGEALSRRDLDLLAMRVTRGVLLFGEDLRVEDVWAVAM